ncbi:hypothetical protein [Vibrio parahaemolyticus]|uniref:hypothetical protein n=1 Tax=Vibrio parahaemolyticus TaxID=670 RepID=UPI001124746B|nr:hypothetical protein [Vibrio parahaemolyticus]MDF4308749.1 hypothetical protein [Vibrio parahaemolyticus]TNZ94615.1 hypothetical protein CGK37_06185 [Vibrio parahaemolyticus]TOA14693.1 hypothetical protein CGK34_08845 [Vibrio parahaemolyticus]HBH7883344.1 hypothetical protein [Vibrio parahaemolyticus]
MTDKKRTYTKSQKKAISERRSEREKRITVRGDFKKISQIKMVKEQYGIGSIVDFIINKKNNLGIRMDVELDQLLEWFEWLIDNQDFDLKEIKLNENEIEDINSSIKVINRLYFRNSNSLNVKKIQAAIDREDIDQKKKSVFQITTTPENKIIYDELKGDKTNFDFINEVISEWAEDIVKPSEKAIESIKRAIENHLQIRKCFRDWHNDIRKEALDLMEDKNISFKNASIEIMKSRDIKKYKSLINDIAKLKNNTLVTVKFINRIKFEDSKPQEAIVEDIKPTVQVPVNDEPQADTEPMVSEPEEYSTDDVEVYEQELPELDEIEEVDLDDLELNENEEEKQPNPFDEIFGGDE